MYLSNPFFVALALVLCGMLNACASTPTAHAAQSARPAAHIAVAVTEDSSLLAQEFQHSLGAHGWILIFYDADALDSGHDYQRLAQRARYRLSLAGSRIGNCRDDSPSFLYNVALIENQTGDVALALTGASCLATAIDRFNAGLERKQLTVQGLGGG